MNEQFLFEEEQLNIKEIVWKVLRHWYLFVIGLIVAFTIVFFVIRNATDIYKVEASVLIGSEEGSFVNLSDLLGQKLGYTDASKINNEIRILKSFSLLNRTIEDLDLLVSYYSDNRFADAELYKMSPFEVLFKHTDSQLVNARIFIRILNDQQVQLRIEQDDAFMHNYSTETFEQIGDVLYMDTLSFYDHVKTSYFTFSLEPTKNFYKRTGDDYYFIFHTRRNLLNQYAGIEVNNEDNSSILSLSLKGANCQKSRDFLNRHIKNYLNRSVHNKSKVINNTINFIESQITGFSDSVYTSAKALEDFRKENDVLDLDMQTQSVFTQTEHLQARKTQLLVQKRFLSDLVDSIYINKSVTNLIIPASLEISDPLLDDKIGRLSELVSEREQLSLSIKKRTPYIEKLDQQILNSFNSLSVVLINSIKSIEISLSEIDERLDVFNANIKGLPKKQLELLSYETKFSVNNDIYTFLLEKRSEYQIAAASNYPVHEVLDNADYFFPVKVSPNIKMYYLMAFFLGLAIPGLLLWIYEIFNDRIRNLEELEKFNKFPVLGHIAYSNNENPVKVFEDEKSMAAEAFRSLRTNMKFVAPLSRKHTYLFTSAVKGEGKSYVSYNMAISLAKINLKTVYVNFDLRKSDNPLFYSGINGCGLSSFLSNNSSVEEILHDSGIKNLSVIPAGSVPPNPSELINSEQTKKLFSELKNRFDAIIVDCPPVLGLSDAFLLLEYSDVNVFVMRQNYTSRKDFDFAVKSIEGKNVNGFNLVVNGVKSNFYGYGYSYGYNKYYDTKLN